MAALKYPIGIQTFSEMIEKRYTYVDKTGYIKPLTAHGKYIFLSRPRRFGKSLLLSTLESYFEGRRELFKSLALYDMDVEWTPSPVLHFDFNAENYSLEGGLEQIIDNHLKRLERKFGRDPELTTPAQRLAYLIEAAYEQTGQQVVILVDEYDKPLLDVEHDKNLFEKNQRILKSFYGNLKSMDRYIRFAMITGVARFSKVSIFSDFNNLDDISLEDTFADICGWTERELLDSFRPGVEALAEKREETFEETLNAMRIYYDGYLFTYGGSRLYNPYSVLRALKAKEIDPYWFSTGSPSFLVKRVKLMGTFPPNLNGQKCTRDELSEVGINDRNPIPLMFQTGYLTIAQYDKGMQLYELRFPNREVEIGFYKDLFIAYVPDTKEIDSPFNFKSFLMDIHKGRPKDFMKRLATLLKNLPGEDHREATYRAITFLLTILCGQRSIAEHHGYKGRSDLEVLTHEYVYIFEFKYNESVEAAMQQIKSRDYAGRYAMDPRTVFLIGANFNSKKEERGLSYDIKTLR